MLLSLALGLFFQEASGNPVELGSVLWGRDHDAAFARAREERKPVLLVFQEIPG